MVCRENMIPFHPRLCTLLRSSFCIALFADDTNTILLRAARCFSTVSRCVAIFLLLYDGLPAGNFFFCGFFSPPLYFFSFSPFFHRSSMCGTSRLLFLFCASTSFPEELFARISTDMSFRSYLVLYIYIYICIQQCKQLETRRPKEKW